MLKTANLGKSGYLLFRPTSDGVKLIYQAKRVAYSFVLPTRPLGEGRLLTAPMDKLHYVQANDILVLTSDGVVNQS